MSNLYACKLLDFDQEHPSKITYKDTTLQKASVRDRKGGTKIWELAPYFYYPINEASKLLNICPTVLKKICRKYGLRRWPHRKLQSIERAIEKQHDLLEAAEKNDVTSQIENIRRQIEALHAQKEELCFGKVSFCN